MALYGNKLLEKDCFNYLLRKLYHPFRKMASPVFDIPFICTSNYRCANPSFGYRLLYIETDS